MNTMKKYLYLTAAYVLPVATFAEETNSQLQNPLKVDSLEALFSDILTKIIIPVSAAIGVVFIIWAGFKFVTAQGNASEIQNARKNLIAVLIGVALVIGAEVILDLLLNTLRQVAEVNP